MAKLKCKRGTSKKAVIPLFTPTALAYMRTKGGKGAKALMKKRLAVSYCTSKTGTTLVKKATLTEEKATRSALTRAKPRPPMPRHHAIPGRGYGRSYSELEAEAQSFSVPRPPPDFELPDFTD